ncbi:Predicted exporter protein, RND superfamily [Natronoarchaeum philippinense]|uniref:Predicted exporter protein, RND superfamily n=1 Tax=Natronoarchaeum philippinense TaxID=558529 RepID=A0A285NDJ3_NATPI|nr:MMPL family transporter [Natronoarchaeum philippinense]SNZ05986.1 Predicted exporter protein, RND superfamily [Natronoarchaeum philippinense]
MSLPDRLASIVMSHSRIVIAAMLVMTLALGSGAGMVEQSSSFDAFQSDNDAVEAQNYITNNFVPPGEENVSRVQVIVRNESGNVLSKESLVSSLEYQQALLDNETINATLDQQQPALGVSNLVAITAISQERAAELQARAGGLSDALNQTAGLQRQYAQLNASYQQGEINESTYQARSAEIEQSLVAVRADATAELSAEQATQFNASASSVRNLTAQQIALQRQYERDAINESTYQTRSAELDQQLQQAYQRGTRGVFAEQFAALQSQESQPSLDAQLQQLESMNESEVDAVLVGTLDPDSGQGMAYQLLSTQYDPDNPTTADARMMILRQEIATGNVQTGSASDVLIESQLAMQDVADAQMVEGDYIVFGFGLISDEITRSMNDSLAIVGPLAMLFVLLALIVAYRDLLDIALGFVGIIAVLLWTFGFMGWAGITFNMIFIAVPVLLIGLSVDYAIHVFMRHREQRQDRSADAGDGVRSAMRVALGGVGATLVWVTATTAIGFLSNLVSPMGPIRDFGIVSSVGILSALVIFGVLVPAVKVELDEFLEARGFDRKKRAFGTGGGRLGDLLSTGETLARKAPMVVIAIALVVSVAGGAAATQVDTSFQQEDFIAGDPPDWMDSLPGPLEPGEYNAKDHMDYVYDNFVVENSQGEVLVRGSVSSPETLHRIDEAQAEAAEMDTAVILSNDRADVQSPLTVMQSAASSNETFNATLTAADTDGDGVPEQNVEQVYDALYRTAPTQAAQVVHRTGSGEYEYQALRMSISVKGGASTGAITEDVRGVAATIDDDGASETRSAVATGTPIVNEVGQNELLDTVIQSLLVTLVTVFAFLAIVYRFQYDSATLGIVTLLPVALSVSWILGTMYLLGMSFNVLTGMITSLTIGMGVAYSIHLSERYNIELDRQDNAWEAMRVSLTGTGGALLGSAATTVGGFGVLVFSIMPPLQQFGIITGMTIIYAFVASVVVLPSLLVVWTRYFGPAETLDASGEETPAADATPSADE